MTAHATTLFRFLSCLMFSSWVGTFAGPGVDESPTPTRHPINTLGTVEEFPPVAAKFAELKAELTRLQTEFNDDGRYADPATWPKGTVDGPFDDKPASGKKTVAEAISLSVVK